MSKALKPVSATKTAETQLEDLMQALPENRLEDLSLQEAWAAFSVLSHICTFCCSSRKNSL